MAKPVRLGAIVPAINVMVEQDFAALCPPGASVHFSRADVPMDLPLAKQFDTMIDAAPGVGRMLAKAEVSAVGFACTSASFHRGYGSDVTIGRAISAEAGVPALTTSTAVVLAMRALGARAVAAATPYVDWVVEAEREFLLRSGFEVRSITGLGLSRGADIHNVPADAVVANALAADTPDADILLVSCTDYAAVPGIREIEERTGKPVVTSNQATLWALARLTGLEPTPAFGRLAQCGLPPEGRALLA